MANGTNCFHLRGKKRAIEKVRERFLLHICLMTFRELKSCERCWPLASVCGWGHLCICVCRQSEAKQLWSNVERSLFVGYIDWINKIFQVSPWIPNGMAIGQLSSHSFRLTIIEFVAAICNSVRMAIQFLYFDVDYHQFAVRFPNLAISLTSAD